MTETRVPAGVGWTSLLTAHALARESLRTDPLVVDPWAEILVAAAGGLGPTPGIDTSEMWGTFLQLSPGGRRSMTHTSARPRSPSR
jgi:O-methyltransferase involved in polyketide biosynthesis